MSKWIEWVLTFAGSMAASLLVLSSTLGVYKEKIERHDREIPELRAQLTAETVINASQAAAESGMSAKLDALLESQRTLTERVNRALDKSR